jgi:hypothetical protein
MGQIVSMCTTLDWQKLCFRIACGRYEHSSVEGMDSGRTERPPTG